MATIGSYTNKDFSPAAKLLSYDSSGVTALIPGQSLLDYIGFDELVIALDNRVEVVRTTDLAVTEDLPVGRVIYTTGVSVENDGGGGHYVVVIAGTGGIPMDNGNELLLLPIGDLTGSDATNADVTTSTGSQTVAVALDDRVVKRQNVAAAVATNAGVGVVIETNTYAGSGGGNKYEVVAGGTGTADGGSFIDMANGNQLKALFPSGKAGVKQFGAKGDLVANDFTPIKNAILFAAKNTHKVFFEDSTGYLISGAGNLAVFTETEIPRGVEVDFNDQIIDFQATRLTDGSQGDQFATNWGAFTFRGSEGATYSHTLTSALTAPIAVLPEPAAHALVEGDLIFIQTQDPAAVPPDEFKYHVINRVMRLDKIAGGLFYFDGRFEFDLPINTVIDYTKVNAIKDVSIKGLSNFQDNSAYDPINKDNGSACVVFELCSECGAGPVQAESTPEHTVTVVKSHRVTLSDGEIRKPLETVQGGYFVQILQSSHVHCERCYGARERHVVDVTASAYVTTSQSGSNSTENATFTTHGAYEHDIGYTDCFGYLSLSNSGATFGSSTRFVEIDDHRGTNLNLGQNAHQGCSDVTIRNSRFPSISYLNVDGLQMDNVEFGNKVYLAQNSSRSSRKNIWNKVRLPDLDIDSLSSSNTDVATPLSSAEIEFKSSFLKFLAGFTIDAGSHKFIDTDVEYSGVSLIEVPVRFEGGSLKSLTGGGGATRLQCSSNITVTGSPEWDRVGVEFTGTGDQVAHWDSGTLRYSDTVINATWESSKTAGSLRLTINGVDVDREAGAGRLFTMITAGAVLQVNANGNQFKNADIRIDPGIFGAGKNALIYTDNTEDAVTITARPVTGSNAVVTDNLAV